MSTAFLRLVLGGLFLFAGVVKSIEHPLFFTQLMEYELFAAQTAYEISWLLIAVEVLLGFWLISGAAPRIAAWSGFALVVVFTAALISAWWRDLEVSCGCFGPFEMGSGYGSWLLRNVILMLTFGWLAWRSPPVRIVAFDRA